MVVLPGELRETLVLQPDEEFVQSWFAHEAWPVPAGGLVMTDGRRFNTIQSLHTPINSAFNGFFPLTWDGRLILTTERLMYALKYGAELLNPTGHGFRPVVEWTLEEVGQPTILKSVHFDRAVLLFGQVNPPRAVALDGRTHPEAVISEIIALAGDGEVGGAPQSSPVEIYEPSSRGSRSAEGWVPPPEAGEGDAPQPTFKEPPTCPLCHQKMLPTATGWDCPTGECEFSG